MSRIKLLFFSAIVFLFSLSAAVAQSAKEKKSPVSKELYDTIFHLDSILFKAFNEKNTEVFIKYFDKDLEFYHDKSGLTDYAFNVEVFKTNFAKGGDLTRTLVKEDLEVFPVPNYGAVQIASHRFCHTENGKPDCGTFKFIHIWKRTENGWKITRIISVDH
ncbi:MAG: nuclear transport factor 2 family protein [Lacibacter sp.]